MSITNRTPWRTYFFKREIHEFVSHGVVCLALQLESKAEIWSNKFYIWKINVTIKSDILGTISLLEIYNMHQLYVNDL